MTQRELNRAVARATGETVSSICSMGFSLADPDEVRFDPEPSEDPEDRIVDWDAVDAERRVLVVA